MKMKIGLVCPYNINKPGGVLEVVLALQKSLVAAGHEAKIITPKPRGSEERTHKDIIFFGTSIDFRSVSHTTAQISNTHDNEELDAILGAEQFDILHFHEPWIPFLSRQLLQRSQSVNIGTFHSKVHESLMTRTVIKVVTPYLNSVMKYLHYLTAVSDSGAEYAASLTDEPITIIPNGIDLNKYQSSPKPTKSNGPKTILYIGRLEKRKGVKYLLQAFSVLTQDNPELHLQIVGDGPDREMLELLADDLRLPNASFLGFISEERKLLLLKEADLFCSPALFGESFGIVLLEAMATGAVSVAGNNTGYTGLMQDLGAISIVNPRDTEEFARRLNLLLNEEQLRVLWQKWAQKHVKQFAYPRIVDQYLDFYHEALRQHGSAD